MLYTRTLTFENFFFVTGGFGAVPGAAPQRGDGGGVGRGGGAEGGENFFEKFGAVPVTGRNAAKLARIFYFFSEPIFFSVKKKNFFQNFFLMGRKLSKTVLYVTFLHVGADRRSEV